MDRKIIFFDIDGTIFSSRIGKVTDRVISGIRQAQKRGNLCFIASGRPKAFIARNIKEIGFDGYVLANGAHIQYGGRDLGVCYLDSEKVRTMCSRFQEGNIQYILSTPAYSYIDSRFTGLLNFYRKCNIDFENLVHEFDREDVISRTLKIEAWAIRKKAWHMRQTAAGNLPVRSTVPGKPSRFTIKPCQRPRGSKTFLSV